ncbi:unnamed protein product [Lymnaea stagnalis]|uniref:Calpain catalytic domain-containing protein n=1 Tax=Lymnaea stagnalis TaxID=6523 RepID=A0AAV2H5P0_LYMST
MGAGIYEEQPRTSQLLDGLESGHAYSITGFYQVALRGSNFNLIRLRNPWGRGEWKGAWSDESKEMNALPMGDKESLLFQIQDDGEFWMDFDDFITMFDEISICKL